MENKMVPYFKIFGLLTFVLFFINFSFGQTVTTTFNPTKQGFQKNSVWNNTTYSYDVSYSNDPSYVVGNFVSAYSQEHFFRCRFDHPNIPNSKITNVKFKLTIGSSVYSSSDPSWVQVQIPYSSCNDNIPWSGNNASQYANLIDCIQNAYLVTSYSVGNSTGSQASYSRDINANTSPNLSSLLQNANSFTFGIESPVGFGGNAVRIISVTADITYTIDPISNNTISGNQTIFPGATASTLTGSTPAGGTGSYTYQWQSSTNGSNWTNISGANGINYSPGVVSTTTYYQRIVNSSPAAASTSAPVTVTVYPPISNNLLTSGDFNLSCNSNNYFNPPLIQASYPSGGNNNYTFQWQKSPTGSSWTNISGATGQNYQPVKESSDIMYYKRIVYSGTISNTSSAVTYTYSYPNPISNNTIDVAGSTTPIYSCNSGSFDPPLISGSTPVGVGGTIFYQWQFSTDNGVTLNDFSGATGKDFDPSAISVTTQIYRKAYELNCNKPSLSAPIVIYITPSNTISGDQNFITCTATPSAIQNTSNLTSMTPIFEWEYSTDQVNWNAIPGANSSTYTPGLISTTTYYRRQMMIDASCTFNASNIITKSITPASTVVSLTSAGLTNAAIVCNNSTIILNVSTAQPSSTYSWYNGGNLISGATSSSYTTNASGDYSVVANNTCGAFTSNTLTVIQKQAPSVSFSQNYSTCYKQSVQLWPTISGGNGAFVYNWTSANSNLLSCTNCQSPIFYSNVNQNYTLAYQLTVTDLYNCSNSSTVYVNTSTPIPGISTGDVNECSDMTGKQYIKAYENIYASENCASGYATVKTGADITFRANMSVILSPGFSTESNSIFEARINNPCADDALRVSNETEEELINVESETNLVEAYPNPSNGLIHVAVVANEETKVDIYLTDMLGNDVKEIHENASQYTIFDLDTRSLSTGVYILRVNMNDKLVTKKMMLE